MIIKRFNILFICLSAGLSACTEKTASQHQHINPDGHPLVLNLEYELYYLKNEPDIYFINGSYYYYQDKWYHCQKYKAQCTFPDRYDMPENIINHYQYGLKPGS